MRKNVKEGIFLNTEYESYMVGDNVSVGGSQIQLFKFLDSVYQFLIKMYQNLLFEVPCEPLETSK